MRRSKLVGLVLLASSSFGCAPQEKAAAPMPSVAKAPAVASAAPPTANATPTAKASVQDPNQLAESLAQGVGVVTRASSSIPGPIVVALEERHNSRIGQLQHAVMLVRMHEHHALRDVVLEGYLKGDPDIETSWFTRSVKGGTPEARASVAVQLLSQGDISAVEFLKLVYPEMKVSYGEEHVNYDVEPPTSMPMIDYLKAISRVDESKALEMAKPYQNAETFKRMSGDEKARSAREMKEYAERRGVSVDASAALAMQQYITFFERRMASNQTIADQLAKVTPSDAVVVATNIGADHSSGLAKLLDGGHRSYAVISPRYVPGDNTKGDLSDDMYDRKNHGLPVFRQGLSQLLMAAVKGKKPPPVMAEPKKWAQASAELRGFVASLTESVLGSGGAGKPPTNDKPPFGFAVGDFDGQRIKIDLSEVEFLKRKNDRGALMIPVVFKDTGDKIWVGAELGERTGAENQKTVEEIVLAAIKQVEGEQRIPDRDEGTNGLTQISNRVRVYVGKDQAEVQKFLMSEV